MENNTFILKILIILISISTILLIVGTFRSGLVTSEDEVIKIGVIDSFSGDGAVYGEWVRKNAELAAEDINKRGGFNGKKIELIYEDHKAVAQESVNAYQRLKLKDVDMMTVGWSSPTLAIAPLANADKKILFTHSATTPLYSTKDDYTFRISINAEQFAKEEADFVFNELDYRNIAVIYINNDFGLGMKKVFIEHFRRLGGNIVFEDNFNQESRDFKSLITKVEFADPDAVFLVGHMTENGLLVKQMRELGIDKQIMSDIYSVEGDEFLKQAGSASEGIIYVAPYFDESKSQEYFNEYLETYGEEPNYYAQVYDIFFVLEKAIDNCKEIDTDCIKDELFKIQDFEGVSGIIYFDEYGDVTKPVAFNIIKNGEFVRFNTSQQLPT